ncbi:MAG: peptidoglycan-binding domain-containing protein [Thiohalocapsa sp.]
MRAIARGLLFAVAPLLVPVVLATAVATVQAAGAGIPQQTIVATAAVVREIQFMLTNVGIDPGPIDGNARVLTNRAAHAFQQRSGLPVEDIVNDQPISQAFVERLRREAARTLLAGTAPQNGAQPPPAEALSQTASVAMPPKPPAPPPDPFASCAYDPANFRIGDRQYTPQSFLDEGFGGVTARAVTNLRQRLEEARQVAENVGGPALAEVQRQAHVLAYFECRQRVEQASAAKK